MTKQEFCNHYYKVFTEDGKVKPCGRNMCIQLIEICNEISAPPGREPLFYGFKVNSWGETFEKCFAPAFLMGLNKMLKK